MHPVGADAYIGPHTALSNFRTTRYGFAEMHRASLPRYRRDDVGIVPYKHGRTTLHGS